MNFKAKLFNDSFKCVFFLTEEEKTNMIIENKKEKKKYDEMKLTDKNIIPNSRNLE